VTLSVSNGTHQNGAFAVKLDGGDASMEKNSNATAHEVNLTSHVQPDTPYLNECILHGTDTVGCNNTTLLWQSFGVDVPQP